MHCRRWLTLGLLALPLLTYLGDVLLRRVIYKSTGTLILSAEVFDTSNDAEVVLLTLEIPDGFSFKSGQYLELKIPSVHPTEFHPFSIASEPEAKHLDLHIKSAGRWTRRLVDLAKDDEVGRTAVLRGPFGAPAQAFEAYSHVLLISSGIGITPMTSVWRHAVSGVERPRKNRKHASVANQQMSLTLVSLSLPPISARWLRKQGRRFSEDELEELQGYLNRRDTTQRRRALRGELASLRLFGEFGQPEKRDDSSSNNEADFVASTGWDLESGRGPAMKLGPNLLFEQQHSAQFSSFPVRFCHSLVGVTAVFWLLTILYSIGLGVRLIGRAKFGYISLATVYGGLSSGFLLASLATGAHSFGRVFIFDPSGLIAIIATVLSVVQLALVILEAIRSELTVWAIVIQSLAYGATAVYSVSTWWRMTAVTDANHDAKASTGKKLRRADFVWVNRTIESSVWFLRHLSKTANVSPWTSSVYLSREDQDAVKSLKTDEPNLTNLELFAGRPDWHAILAMSLDEAHESCRGAATLGVFFCGSPSIAQAIRATISDVEREHFQHWLEHDLRREGAFRACTCRIMLHVEKF